MINLNYFKYDYEAISFGGDGYFYDQNGIGYLKIRNNAITLIKKISPMIAINEIYGDYLHKIIVNDDYVVFQLSILKPLYELNINYDTKEGIKNSFGDFPDFKLAKEILNSLDIEVYYTDESFSNIGLFKGEYVFFDPFFSVNTDNDFEFFDFINLCNQYNIPIMIG